MKEYKLHVYYKNELIGKYDTRTDDWNDLYDVMSYDIIKQGFKSGYTIPQQIEKFKLFCEAIYKQKINCYKIRHSDFFKFLSCYLALVKYNIISLDNFIFIKKKNRKNAVILQNKNLCISINNGSEY
tara:strand:+ start:113 stop:493 length:381 start_codon:yes stop_codon:yes gene_type:complete